MLSASGSYLPLWMLCTGYFNFLHDALHRREFICTFYFASVFRGCSNRYLFSSAVFLKYYNTFAVDCGTFLLPDFHVTFLLAAFDDFTSAVSFIFFPAALLLEIPVILILLIFTFSGLSGFCGVCGFSGFFSS